MCIKLRCGEPGRQRLGNFLAFLNICMALFGFCLIWVAAYIKLKIETRTILLEGYDTGLLPQFLLTIGCLLCVLHSLGAKISRDCGYAETRSTFQNMLMFFIVILAAMSIVIIAGGSMCFAHRSLMSKAFHKGLLSKMALYKEDALIKETLDSTQLAFKCCGSRNYKDWFSVSWVKQDYININHPTVKRKLRDGNYYSDDVPFSCCRVNVSRPCIFHKVSQKSAHPLYTSFETTLNKKGCTEVLGSFYEEIVLLPTGQAVFSSFGLEVLIIILLRHLQTSISEAVEEGDPEGPGDAYCFSQGPCCEAEDPLKPLKRRDKLAEQEADDE